MLCATGLPAPLLIISGGGIAGLTLGILLKERGWNPLVIEREPSPRSGGYMMDFFGTGWDVAERMGLTAALRAIRYPIDSLQYVDDRGAPYLTVPMDRVRRALRTATSTCSGPISNGSSSTVPGRPASRSASEHRSAHSPTRATTWLSPLSLGSPPVLASSSAPTVSIPASASWPSAPNHRSHATSAATSRLSTHRSTRKSGNRSPSTKSPAESPPSITSMTTRCMRCCCSATMIVISYHRKTACRSCAAASKTARGSRQKFCDLPEHEHTPVFFDSLTQIVMPHWSAGRICLIGDACGCLTLAAGQGSHMAMAGAYVLATELARHRADHRAVFEAYEKFLKPHVDRKQAAAARLASRFVPAVRARMWLRRLVLPAMFSRLFLPLFIRLEGSRSVLRGYGD